MLRKHWSAINCGSAVPGANVFSITLPVLLLLLLSWPAVASDAANRPDFVGRQVCASCHAAQEKLWRDSHHDLAMQEATAETVLGDFNDSDFTHAGTTSRFFRKDDRFMVRTDGPDGKLTDYEIKYTFGVAPLQQYLIAFPGGRLQALSIAWDARPQAQGGQRWFHLYPDEQITHDDELHWTRLNQNWNNMCAECHSTHLQKNYDPLHKSFDTRWSEIDVSCEACHGPGALHVDWANKEPGWEKLAGSKGLTIALDERQDVHWQPDTKTGTSQRSKPREGRAEIEMCARCHARRSVISAGYVHGEPLLDHYLPRLLDAGMYYPDGQIEDEVYVYGSFLQSRMHEAGVTCSDCHEPHSLQLRQPGSGVCLQCHAANKFATAAHHFHKPDAAGASCVECHMPPRDYMVLDPRHDHSFRIPRPDLSVTLGTPNACNVCHTDKSAQWAATQMQDWYGHVPQGLQNWAGTFATTRGGDPRAGESLLQLIRDTGTPAIVRATALSQVGTYLNAQSLDVLTQGLWDDDPGVRAATTGMLEQLPAGLRVQLAFPFLQDDVRAVRIEAARVLASVPAGDLDARQQALLEQGIQEFIASQLANAERPEAQTNLGNLYAQRGQLQQAEQAYRTAIELNPAYTPAWVNLADYYRGRQDEAAAEKTLREAIAGMPGVADLHYALGLSLIRQQQSEAAVAELQQAATLNSGSARYIYVYAVALNSTGKPDEALLVLQGAHNRFPNDTDILGALIAFNRDQGNTGAASRYTKKLQALLPPAPN
jgi:predicted CXXCH cytochrome family protein